MSNLIKAIRAAHPIEEIVPLLDDEKAINAEGQDGKVPLQVVLHLDESPELYRRLPRHLAHLSPEQMTQQYFIPLLHQLLDHGASASHFTSDDLLRLSSLKDPSLLEKLLQHGLDADLQGPDEATLLMMYLYHYRNAHNNPARAEWSQLIDVLLQHHPEPTIPTRSASTPGATAVHILFTGTINPFVMSVAERIVTPENVNREDDEGKTPIIYYAKRIGPDYRGDLISPEQVVQFLEERGAVLSHTDHKDHDALWWARQNRNNALLRVLQEKESQRLKNVEEIIVSSTGNKNRYGFTPNIAKQITGFMGSSGGGRKRQGKRKTRRVKKAKKAKKTRNVQTRRRK